MKNEKLSTNFDFSHCHKWLWAIKKDVVCPSYRAYWQAMVGNMQSLSKFLLKDESVKSCCVPDNNEVAKINQLFIDDTAKLLSCHKLSDDARDCLGLRIEENKGIIEVALIMRNIVQRFGEKRLREIVSSIQDEFVQAFNEILLSNKKLQRGAMNADHEITRTKKSAVLIGRMHNCPAYGVFKFLDLLDECKEFCVLCEAHGKTIKLPFGANMNLTKCFSHGDKCCEFSLNIKNRYISLILKLLPDRFFQTKG